MFTIVAALLFFFAFLLAMGVMGAMFSAYRHKMVAALLMEPQPQIVPVCTVSVRRRRGAATSAMPAPLMRAALAA